SKPQERSTGVACVLGIRPPCDVYLMPEAIKDLIGMKPQTIKPRAGFTRKDYVLGICEYCQVHLSSNTIEKLINIEPTKIDSPSDKAIELLRGDLDIPSERYIKRVNARKKAGFPLSLEIYRGLHPSGHFFEKIGFVLSKIFGLDEKEIAAAKN